MPTEQTRVCPVELADSLDSKLRRWLQNPRKILAPYVAEGMIALEPVDFILTFYMVHEVPDQAALFRQLFHLLRETGKLLLVEPKLFHVSRAQFRETVRQAEAVGFVSTPGPTLLMSWSAVLTK
ncbi:class I SAM-dependent methyltransferase [bacterium]|nr:class I SAM-dependent methyltransferase [bacterium]